MIFPLCKWYFDINWHKFEKRWADFFQIYPNAIHLNPLQFCPSIPLLGFPVFCLSSSIVLNRHFHILVNSMIIWSGLRLPKIAWPGPSLRPWGFTLKMRQMFFVHTTPGEFKKASITSHSVLCVYGQLIREITWVLWNHRFRKSNCFPSTQKRKASVFKFLQFEERFRNAPCSWRISVDGRPNRRNRAAFQISPPWSSRLRLAKLIREAFFKTENVIDLTYFIDCKHISREQ